MREASATRTAGQFVRTVMQTSPWTDMLPFFIVKYRYTITAQELQRVNLLDLTENEKLAFFLNLFNAMVIHAVIRIGSPESIVDRRSFFSDFQYVVGGYAYSLSNIRNGILRSNRRPPYSFVKPFAAGDKRLEVNHSYSFNLKYYPIEYIQFSHIILVI